MSLKHQSAKLIPIILLVLSALACQTITKVISPEQSSAVPVPEVNNVNLTVDWLITEEELNSFSTDTGIVAWQLIKETPGENRICRTFQGASWSASPNEGLNCIYTITPGSSFADIIDSMFSEGNLLEGAQPVYSSLDLGGEFAIYAGDYPNGHGVYDLFLVKDNLVFWSSVTLGIPAGNTPSMVYESSSAAIDLFLANIVLANIEKRK